MKNLALFAALMLTIVSPAVADQSPCPCVPSTPVWIATSCGTWNCAQATMILAGGDPYTMTFPTGGSQHKWIVVRRVVQGSVTVSPDEPFTLESFPSPSDAVARFSSYGPEMLPVMLTTIDGQTLVIRLKQPDLNQRRPAAGH